MDQTASWAQRALALLIDWTASVLVVIGFIGLDGYSNDPAASLYILGVFVLESTLFTAFLGGSFGKLVCRLRVVNMDGSGRPLSLLNCLLRQVMVALVIPPLVFRPDGRGLHDMVTKSATMTLASLQGRR